MIGIVRGCGDDRRWQWWCFTFVTIEAFAHTLAAVTQSVVRAFHATVVVEAGKSGVLYLWERRRWVGD